MINKLSFFLFLVAIAATLYVSGSVEYAQGLASDVKQAESKESARETEKIGLLSRMKEQEDSLKEKEKLLQLKELDLREREEVLDERAKNYEKVITQLRKELDASQVESEEEAKKFSAVYSQMEPKPAAKILDSMTVPMASRILGSLSRRKAAQIMERMSPERAKLITERQLSSKKP